MLPERHLGAFKQVFVVLAVHGRVRVQKAGKGGAVISSLWPIIIAMAPADNAASAVNAVRRNRHLVFIFTRAPICAGHVAMRRKAVIMFSAHARYLLTLDEMVVLPFDRRHGRTSSLTI